MFSAGSSYSQCLRVPASQIKARSAAALGLLPPTLLELTLTRLINVPYRLVHAEHHLNHQKDEAVTTCTIAIIPIFFDRVIAIGLLYNLYHVYLDRRLIAQPQLLTFSRAASAASRDDRQAATLPNRF
jgi:hypothetical protein